MIHRWIGQSCNNVEIQVSYSVIRWCVSGLFIIPIKHIEAITRSLLLLLPSMRVKLVLKPALCFISNVRQGNKNCRKTSLRPVLAGLQRCILSGEIAALPLFITVMFCAESLLIIEVNFGLSGWVIATVPSPFNTLTPI